MRIAKGFGFAVIALSVVNVTAAESTADWARVTVFLETSAETAYRAEEAVLPAGVYPLDEVGHRGIQSIDSEIASRVAQLRASLEGVEESMRLASLQVRQYYLPLVIGEDAVLPVIDLNPRLGIVITPKELKEGFTLCRVRFLEPEGEITEPVFSGEPISLRLKDADLHDVLRVFSKLVPVTMEVDPSVEGTVTVDLRDVPWDQALDLVLRINGLGWVKEGETLWIAPQTELSNRKRVRTEATVTLPRGGAGGMIASRGDADTPTVVVTIESVDGPPEMVAERAGLLRPIEVALVRGTEEELGTTVGELAALRGTITEEGKLVDAKVLASPSQSYSNRLIEAVSDWRFRPILDQEGIRQRAIAGFGIRFGPTKVLASIGAIEHIGAEVSCQPVPERPGMYVIRAKVFDLDSGRVISNPQVFTMGGSEAKVRTGLQMPNGEPTTLNMSFLVDEDGKGITYSWTLTSDGKVLSSHKAEFAL